MLGAARGVVERSRVGQADFRLDHVSDELDLGIIDVVFVELSNLGR